MQTVSKIADEILDREGGYVNDPDDRGGPTKFGVTLATLKRHRKNARLTARDVANLTRAEAKEILITRHFNAPRIASLPNNLHATVFDMHVNAGARAVRILQQLLNSMGRFALREDGVIGPKTHAAAFEIWQAAPDTLYHAYGIARRNYYYALGDTVPRLRKFARRRDGGKGGWITRAETFMAAKYHLSDTEHAQRVAAWG